MPTLCRVLLLITILSLHGQVAISETAQRTEIDSDHTIHPIFDSITRIFDALRENTNTLEYADEAKKGRNENMLEKSIFDLIMQKATTTTPRPLIERLLQPFLEPIKIELKKLEKASQLLTERSTTTTTISPETLLRGQISPPQFLLNSDSIRRFPQQHQTGQHFTPANSPFKVPLMSLLESLGQNANKHHEVQVGRDESVSILGMPVGRRDGLLLSPLEGLSYGNQD
uniref:Uncharacterized protein n=2 Tax=Parascaris univalens TaxID=6257 RepID=A0A915B747_PARUN